MQVICTHASEKRGTDALKRALADIDAPGWCVAYGDRPAMLKAALDERYKGNQIVHVGGGETLHYGKHYHPDHWTRDAISMISSLHFVANSWAAAALREIGLKDIYVTGCPSLDEVVALSKTPAPKRGNALFDWCPETMLSFQPVTQRRLSKRAFLQRLRTCGLFQTNSSAGLREAPILGTPVLMIGDRQAGRAPAGTYHHPEGKACEEIARICREVCK